MKPPLEMNFSKTEQLSLSERWKETMQLYLGLNMSKSSEKEQCAAFRYVIGHDGRDIYNTMKFTEAQTDKIDVLFAKFDEYCEPRRNTIMERYKFNTRVQRDDEAADRYVTEIKLLAKCLTPRAIFLFEMRNISPVSFEWRLLEYIFSA